MTTPSSAASAALPPAGIPHPEDVSTGGDLAAFLGAGVPAAEGMLVGEQHCPVPPKALPDTAVLRHSKDSGLVGSLAVHVIYWNC